MSRVIRFPRTNACCETFVVEQDVQRIDNGAKTIFTLHVRVRNQSGRNVTDVSATLPLNRAFLLNGEFVDLFVSPSTPTAPDIIVEVTEGTPNPFYDGVSDIALLTDTLPTLPPRSSLCFRVLVCFESSSDVDLTEMTLSTGAVFTVCGTTMCVSRCQPPTCRRNRYPSQRLEETTVKGSVKLRGTPLCALPEGTPDIEVTKRLCLPETTDTDAHYVIRVCNVGTEPLANITLTDTFDTNTLTFVGASPAESSVDAEAGTVVWTNLKEVDGCPLLFPGECIYVCVSFQLARCSLDAFPAGSSNSAVVQAVGQNTDTIVADGPASAEHGTVSMMSTGSATVQNFAFLFPIIVTGDAIPMNPPTNWTPGTSQSLGVRLAITTQTTFSNAVGRQVAFINAAGFVGVDPGLLYQDLTETYTENVSYTMTVALGKRGPGQTPATGVSQIQFRRTDGSLLAATNVDAALLSSTTLTDFSVTHTVTSGAPEAGEPIRVQLDTTQPGGAQFQWYFDNVRVTCA